MNRRQLCEYLGVFAKDLGVETDPVVGDEQFPLIQNISLQGAGVAWWRKHSDLEKSSAPHVHVNGGGGTHFA